MSLIHLIVVLVVVGLLLGLVNYIPIIDAKIKQIINIVVIVAVVIWLLTVFFGSNLGGVSSVKVPTYGHGCSVGIVGRQAPIALDDCTGPVCCTAWMKQDDGSSWRTCVDSRYSGGKQYCESARNGHVDRVSCS